MLVLPVSGLISVQPSTLRPVLVVKNASSAPLVTFTDATSESLIAVTLVSISPLSSRCFISFLRVRRSTGCERVFKYVVNPSCAASSVCSLVTLVFPLIAVLVLFREPSDTRIIDTHIATTKDNTS